jgi:hypothetical protein
VFCTEFGYSNLDHICPLTLKIAAFTKIAIFIEFEALSSIQTMDLEELD